MAVLMSDTYAEAGSNTGSDGRSWSKRFYDKIRSILGSSRRLDGRSGKQFMRALSADFQKLKQGDRLPDNQAVATDIEATLARYTDDLSVDWLSNDVWIDAYRIERLMINLYEGDQVSIELSRRIANASDQKLGFADFYRNSALSAEPGSILKSEQIEANRTLLGYLIDDLQWHYNQLYLKREYANAAQRRVAWTFFVALTIFVVVMVAHFNPANIAAELTAVEPVETPANGGTEP